VYYYKGKKVLPASQIFKGEFREGGRKYPNQTLAVFQKRKNIQASQSYGLEGPDRKRRGHCKECTGRHQQEHGGTFLFAATWARERKPKKGLTKGKGTGKTRLGKTTLECRAGVFVPHDGLAKWMA